MSMGELGLIVLIGLLVLNPSQLVKLCRSIGRYVRHAQQLISTVKDEFDHVVNVNDLTSPSTQHEQKNTRHEVNQTEKTIHEDTVFQGQEKTLKADEGK